MHVPPKQIGDRFQKVSTRHRDDPGIGTTYTSFHIEKSPISSSVFMSDMPREGVRRKNVPGPAYYKQKGMSPKKTLNQKKGKKWL